MTRLHRTSVAVLLACVLLGTTAACNDESPPPRGGTTSHSPSGSPGRPAAYAVSIELADVGGSGVQPTPQPGQPVLVTVTNTGTKADAFLLQLRPPDVGGVSPMGVQLKPGTETQVRVVLLPPQPGRSDKISMVAISRTSHQEVGHLDLQAPAAE